MERRSFITAALAGLGLVGAGKAFASQVHKRSRWLLLDHHEMSPINMNRNPGSPVIIEGYDLSATIGDHLGWKLTGYKWEDGINAKVVTENLSSMRIVDGREYGFDDGQVLVELRSDKTEKGCYWGALQAIKIG